MLGFVLTIPFPATTGTNTEEVYAAVPLPGRWKLVAIRWAPGTAITANDTNNVVCTITKNNGAAGSDVAIGSFTTNVAYGDVALKATKTIAIAAGGSEFVQGEQVKIAKTVGGTGGTLDGAFTFAFEKIPSVD